MRSPHLAVLESFLRSKSNANELEVRAALTGLSSEVKDRLKVGKPSSIEFFSSSVRALLRLRGSGHADVRISCLADISMFFVTQGYPAEAVAAATEIGV